MAPTERKITLIFPVNILTNKKLYCLEKGASKSNFPHRKNRHGWLMVISPDDSVGTGSENSGSVKWSAERMLTDLDFELLLSRFR